MIRIFKFNQKISVKMPIFISVVILSIISLFVLNYIAEHKVQRHLIMIILGSALFFLIQFIRLRFFHEKINLIYFSMLILMCLPFTQPEIRGAKNWFLFFQPSEPSKLIIVMALAKFLSDNKKRINDLYPILISGLIILLPVLILVAQKDVGTALIYLSILMPMLYWSGLNSFYIFLFFSPILSLYVNMIGNVYAHNVWEGNFPFIALIVWIFIILIVLMRLFLRSNNFNFNKYLYLFLTIVLNIGASFVSEKSWNYLTQDEAVEFSHVKTRIESFISPSHDVRGSGWQVNQSMMAIGAGGLFGGEANQVKLKFLPDADTDFIISSIAESFGFLTILLIISIYLFLLYWLLNYAQKSRSNFLSLLVIGYLTILLAHIFITLGMAVSLAPVTGVPAPFLSYGGSFTLTCFAMLGICNNISNNI